MTSAAATTSRPLAAPIEHVFPRLTAAQIGRFAAHGRRRPVARGEVRRRARADESSW